MSFSLDTATLYRAIEVGNKKEVLQLIQDEKLDLHERNKSGNTALHLLLESKNFKESDVVDLLKIFHDRGLDPNIQNNEKLTVLHLAVAKRWKNPVNFLLPKVKIDMCDKRGNSIMHYLVEDEKKSIWKLLKSECTRPDPSVIDRVVKIFTFKKFDSEIEKIEFESANFVEWLISKGFDCNCRNKKGQSALDLSIQYNLHHITFVLLKHNENMNFIDENGRTFLHLFFKVNANFRHRYQNYIVKENWYQYNSRYATKIIKFLLDMGLSALAVDSEDQTPLSLACTGKEEVEMIEMLIQSLPKNNNDVTTALEELLKSYAWWDKLKTDDFWKILRYLITEGADLNVNDKNGMTAIYYAFEAKNRKAVNFLSDYRANFAVITNSNENLFHALAKKSIHGELVSYEESNLLYDILEKNDSCNVNARNNNNETPLHVAILDANLPIIYSLLQFGVEVNCQNASGQTPLHLMVKNDSGQNIVQTLLRTGADVNAKDFNGQCPLHLAANKDSRLVSLLLEQGGWVNLYADNKSPFYLAIEGDYLNNTRKMLCYGADINDHRIASLVAELKLDNDSTKVVMQHWIKLKVAKLPCSKEYETIVKSYEKYQKHYDKCSSEIVKLKATFLDSDTSIYKYLHMDFRAKFKYVDNEELKNLIKSPRLESLFPKYFVFILASYREVEVRSKLWEPGKEAWFEVTGIDLPEHCIELIFSYLGNEDLACIIECDKSR